MAMSLIGLVAAKFVSVNSARALRPAHSSHEHTNLCHSSGKPGFMSAGFFFSSRRRHTRSTRDWSSDVCSSDLDGDDAEADVVGAAVGFEAGAEGGAAGPAFVGPAAAPADAGEGAVAVGLGGGLGDEIGRASCRGRVES